MYTTTSKYSPTESPICVNPKSTKHNSLHHIWEISCGLRSSSSLILASQNLIIRMNLLKMLIRSFLCSWKGCLRNIYWKWWLCCSGIHLRIIFIKDLHIFSSSVSINPLKINPLYIKHKKISSFSSTSLSNLLINAISMKIKILSEVSKHYSLNLWPITKNFAHKLSFKS